MLAAFYAYYVASFFQGDGLAAIDCLLEDEATIGGVNVGCCSSCIYLDAAFGYHHISYLVVSCYLFQTSNAGDRNMLCINNLIRAVVNQQGDEVAVVDVVDMAGQVNFVSMFQYVAILERSGKASGDTVFLIVETSYVVEVSFPLAGF